VLLLSILTPVANAQTTSLQATYQDETHCLVAGEIRGDADRAYSCYCRDALAEARYVSGTYVQSGKDLNLIGVLTSLEIYAGQMCAATIDSVDKAVHSESGWSGPQITRTYPPDSTIEQLTPDKNGNRKVAYTILLTFHDKAGRVTKIDTFTTADTLPADFKKRGCPPSYVCPK
jgi:hypothetical protein